MVEHGWGSYRVLEEGCQMRRSNMVDPSHLHGGPIALVGSGIAGASPGYDLSWNVIGGGGGASSSGVYTLEGTIGQALVGSFAVRRLRAGGGLLVRRIPRLSGLLACSI